MRYIFLLILSSFSISIKAQIQSDLKVTYAIKDASLEEIFEDLETQYGIRFSYATAAIEHKVLDASFVEEPIFDVLDYLFADASMEYKIVSNNILLKKSNHYKEMESPAYEASLHIRGRVTSHNNENQNLDFATISISNSSIGTYSDDKGRFDIEIPTEYLNENLVIHYLGFEDEVYKISELADEFLLVALSDGQISIDEIMIVNKEKPLRIGQLNGNIQMSKTQIGSTTSGVMGGDISRQIQLLPGIVAHEDNSAAIKIRGSNSDETLMILDGMPIYNANHYYGIFSNLNTRYIDSVNIFMNSYPLHYGGKTAGLVELFSDRSQPQKIGGNVLVDLMTASVDARIPLTKRSHLSVAGRTTLKKINNKLFNISNTPTQNNPLIQSFSQRFDDRKNDPNFTFHDVNVKYQYQNDANDFFTINLFRSGDVVTNQFKTTVTDFNQNEIRLVVVDDQEWFNTAGSMMFSKNLGSKIRWNTTAYYTHYQNEEVNDFKLDKKYKHNNPPPSGNPLTAELSSRQDNDIRDYSLDSYIDYNMGSSKFKLGLATTFHDIHYQFKENKKNKLTGNDEFYEIAAYGGYDFKVGDRIDISTGLRSTYFTNLEEMKYSPRLRLAYRASDKVSFKSSYSLENQVIRQFNYEYRGEPMELWVSAGGNDIPVLRSNNYMVGSTLRLSPFVIDVELYQKNIKGQLEYLLPRPGEASNNAEQIRDYELFKGNGLIRGVDVIISSGYKLYDTYISYTLSKSQQQFKEIYKNNYFASESDRRHQFKWVNTLSTGNFTWGLNTIYVSGRPYTDVRTVGQTGDLRDLDPNLRLKRLPAYHRIDFSADYAFSLRGLNASLTASVFNLMNTKNVKYIQAVSTQLNLANNTENVVVGNESELLNRTFNLGLQIGF